MQGGQLASRLPVPINFHQEKLERPLFISFLSMPLLPLCTSNSADFPQKIGYVVMESVIGFG